MKREKNGEEVYLPMPKRAPHIPIDPSVVRAKEEWYTLSRKIMEERFGEAKRHKRKSLGDQSK